MIKTKSFFTGAISIILATHLMADNGEINKDLGDIEVVGSLIQGQADAIERQKEAKTIVNIVSSEGIGKLPDRNAAEAAARIPGVSIERDQGEGRFISVRGLPSQWSSTTLNGNRLPTAEQQTTSRATAFDFFPSEMIERIEVYKALRPDIEGDAIGGSVNFVTATAPEKQILSVTGAYTYNEKAKEGGHNVNFLYGDRVLDDKFGFLIDITSWNRKWATDNFEARRNSGEEGIYRLELRDYTGERQTYGLNTAADYRINDKNKIFFRGVYGSLEDHETNYKERYRFDKYTPEKGGRVEIQNIFNTMEHETKIFDIGGEHKLTENDKLDWKLSTAENSFKYNDTPNAADSSYFMTQFDKNGVMFEGLENRGDGWRSYNTIDGGISSALTPSTHLPDNYAANPGDFKFTNAWLWEGNIVERDKVVAQLDWKHNVSDDLELKFGLKYRDKERIQSEADKYYTWNATKAGAPAPTLAQLTTINHPNASDFSDTFGVNYGSDFSQVLPEGVAVDWWNANRDSFVLNTNGTYPTATVENGLKLSRNFKIEEQHKAAYGMATWDYSDQINILGGVRLEHTATKVIGQVYDTATKILSPSVATKNYLSVLPSIHVTYSPQDNIKYRAAVTRSFARPDFGDLSTGGVYESNNDKYVVGNPDLNPTYSLNYDVAAEYYFGKIGLLSAGLFYKDITDPIFESTSSKVIGGTAVTVNTSLNGDAASLWGAEFTFNTQFDMLPGMLSNFGINTNITLMDSKMKIPGRDGDVKIPRQADLLYNATLFYDDGAFNTRLAYNYKGAYIMEHGDSAQFDEYYGENKTLDLSMGYNINKNFSVFAEINNLTDEAMLYYQGVEERPLQYEVYGRRGQIGAKYTF